MTTPYNKYKNTKEWQLIEKAIKELIQNQDIKLTTKSDYVVGYITKQLVDDLNTNQQ